MRKPKLRSDGFTVDKTVFQSDDYLALEASCDWADSARSLRMIAGRFLKLCQREGIPLYAEFSGSAYCRFRHMWLGTDLTDKQRAQITHLFKLTAQSAPVTTGGLWFEESLSMQIDIEDEFEFENCASLQTATQLARLH